MIFLYIAILVLVCMKWPDYGLMLLTLVANGPWSASYLQRKSDVYQPLTVLNIIVPILVSGPPNCLRMA